jgi:hypothetical protein
MLVSVEWRMRHPVDSNGIEMSREQERRSIRATGPGNDIGPIGSGILQLDLEAPPFQNTREESRRFLFAWAIRGDRRITRIDSG